MSVKLTLKQEFCLRRLSEGDFCGWEISTMAKASGANKTMCSTEWADAPLRELRAKGLADLTGQKSRLKRRIHRITEAGRAAISAKESSHD